MMYRDRQVPEESIAAAVRPAPSVQIESMFLYKRWMRRYVQLADFFPPVQHVPRVSVVGMTAGQFMELYDRPSAPVILCNAMDDWPGGYLEPEYIVRSCDGDIP